MSTSRFFVIYTCAILISLGFEAVFGLGPELWFAETKVNANRHPEQVTVAQPLPTLYREK
jgi:hypothetical protein